MCIHKIDATCCLIQWFSQLSLHHLLGFHFRFLFTQTIKRKKITSQIDEHKTLIDIFCWKEEKTKTKKKQTESIKSFLVRWKTTMILFYIRRSSSFTKSHQVACTTHETKPNIYPLCLSSSIAHFTHKIYSICYFSISVLFSFFSLSLSVHRGIFCFHNRK